MYRAASTATPSARLQQQEPARPSPTPALSPPASNQDMAVVDDSDAVSRFEAALAAHRRLNAREDALADAQRAALERAESHDLAPPTPPVQASELQQLLDEFEAHAPAEETKTSAPPPKVTKGSGGGVYGRAARRNANQGTSRDEYGDPGPALEAISDAAATAARVTGDGLELAAKGVAVAAGATVAVVVGAAAATGAAAVEGAKVAGPAIRDAANATAEITSDAVEAAGPILQDAADATVEAAGRAADVAGPVIRDAADATVEYAGKAADAAGPVLRDAAEATSQAASAAVEQMQEIDWGDVDPGCSYNCGILEDTDLTRMGEMLGGAAAPAPRSRRGAGGRRAGGRRAGGRRAQGPDDRRRRGARPGVPRRDVGRRAPRHGQGRGLADDDVARRRHRLRRRRRPRGPAREAQAEAPQVEEEKEG